MPNDLCRTIINGSIRTIEDDNNPICANLFALGVRETIRIMLSCTAPDQRVQKAPWFISAMREKESNKNEEVRKRADEITRRDRMRFATQGGLTDQILTEIGLDPEQMHKALLDKVSVLSKFAHISLASLLNNRTEVISFVEDVALTVIEFVEQIRAVQEEVAAAVSEAIRVEATSALTETEVDGLDELSTHTRVDEVAVEIVKVIAIDENYVHIEAAGTVYVELVYGSGSDERNGGGARMSDNYPFKIALRASVNDLHTIERAGTVCIDNSSFYN